MIHVDQATETIEGLLNHGATCAHDVKELLGALGGRHRPKTTANAAGHDDEMICH